MPTLFVREQNGKRRPIEVSGESYERITGVPRCMSGNLFEKLAMERANALFSRAFQEYKKGEKSSK